MSTAYNNYVSARCIEVLENDEEYKKANDEIVKRENELLSKAPKELIPLILKLDELKEKQTSDNYIKIYLAGRSERL